ncbi:hypothetical protein BKA81DRAFT_343349 [Phyllosticta paracitricarpa]
MASFCRAAQAARRDWRWSGSERRTEFVSQVCVCCSPSPPSLRLFSSPCSCFCTNVDDPLVSGGVAVTGVANAAAAANAAFCGDAGSGWKNCKAVVVRRLRRCRTCRAPPRAMIVMGSAVVGWVWSRWRETRSRARRRSARVSFGVGAGWVGRLWWWLLVVRNWCCCGGVGDGTMMGPPMGGEMHRVGVDALGGLDWDWDWREGREGRQPIVSRLLRIFQLIKLSTAQSVRQ